MKKQSLKVAISAGLISLGMVSSADAALVGRLAATSGGTDYQAYYDDVANLTWLADANYAQTSGYDADGRMTWQAANDWAAQLTVGSVSGWRLANADEACFGYNCTGSELGGLYYNALGNSLIVGAPPTPPPPDQTTISAEPFSNVQSNLYWSATLYGTGQNTAYYFSMRFGTQNIQNGPLNERYGWALQTGDVSAVPVPAAVWLFGSGLLGLVGVARRKKV